MSRPKKPVPRHVPPPRMPTTLYSSLLPLHYVTNVLGLGMLKYTSAGNLTVSRFGTLYSLTMGALFFGCFVFAVEDVRIISEDSGMSPPNPDIERRHSRAPDPRTPGSTRDT